MRTLQLTDDQANLLQIILDAVELQDFLEENTPEEYEDQVICQINDILQQLL